MGLTYINSQRLNSSLDSNFPEDTPMSILSRSKKRDAKIHVT